MSNVPAPGSGTGNVAQPITQLAPAGQSVLTTLVDALKAFASGEATAISSVMGVFITATQSIRVVASGVATAAVQSTLNTVNAKYQGAPLTPAVLADMVVRNILPDSTGGSSSAPAGWPAPLMSGVDGHTATVEASYSGLDGNRFAALALDTGESYGIIDALRLYNRGKKLVNLSQGPDYATGVPLYVGTGDMSAEYGITEAELDSVIAYSRVRNQFAPDLLKLALNTLSPADAVEMVVKQVVDFETGLSLYTAAGGMPEQFQPLVDAAGDAAGVEKVTQLHTHGVITAGQLAQAVGLSRMNPRFYYLTEPTATTVAPLAMKWLDTYHISEALKAGNIDSATAAKWLAEDGYPPDQVAAFTGTNVVAQVVRVKEETAGMILAEYEARIYTQAEATTYLSALGYTATAIPFMLGYAEARGANAARSAALARVRASYLVSDITAAQVTTDLGTLGIPQAAITNYLADWGVEKATPKLHLSAAEVGKLAKEGYLDAAQAQAKWVAMGYSATDAALLVLLYPPASLQPPGAGSPAVTAG